MSLPDDDGPVKLVDHHVSWYYGEDDRLVEGSRRLRYRHSKLQLHIALLILGIQSDDSAEPNSIQANRHRFLEVKDLELDLRLLTLHNEKVSRVRFDELIPIVEVG